MIFSISLFLSFLIFVWLKTNAFVEYYNLAQLNIFKSIMSYNKRNEKGFIENFAPFLIGHKDYSKLFIVRLITCPICLSFWTGIIFVLFGGFQFIGLPALTLIFYYLLSILTKFEQK